MQVNLKFPVLSFSEELVEVVKTEKELTTCSSAALRRYFTDLLLIDSNGKAVCVNGAKKLHIVWRFWQSVIFLNPIIKVELLAGELFSTSIDDVRKKVLISFKRWHGWSTRGDFKELQERVKTAQSVTEIVQLLQS